MNVKSNRINQNSTAAEIVYDVGQTTRNENLNSEFAFCLFASVFLCSNRINFHAIHILLRRLHICVADKSLRIHAAAIIIHQTEKNPFSSLHFNSFSPVVKLHNIFRTAFDELCAVEMHRLDNVHRSSSFGCIKMWQLMCGFLFLFLFFFGFHSIL